MRIFKFWNRFAIEGYIFETYGCRYNFGDTAKSCRLKVRGCTIVDSAEAADAVIINTCTVVGPTE